MSIANVLSSMTTVYDLIIGMFANVITTITSNPLIFVPVLIALLGGIVMFAIGVIRRLGVRGISSSGRRRSRRRR